MIWTILFVAMAIFAITGSVISFLKSRNIELVLKFIASVMPVLEEAAKKSSNKWDDKAIAKIKNILGIIDDNDK